MTEGASTVSGKKSTPRRVWAAVVLLLALYAGMTLTASMGKGASFDETEELAVGYDIWLHQDFRMEGANGDLVKRWATLPYLISHPAFPGTDTASWLWAEPYALGYRFLFQGGNEPSMLLLQGRVMIILLGIATGLLVFYCSQQVFGAVGGLVSLALFAFSPHMLAFGGIVSTEMSICLTLLGSTWCIWQLLHRVTWPRLLASLVFLALLFLSKATALVIFPITVGLMGWKIFWGKPLEWQLGRSYIVCSRATQAGIFFALFVLHGLCCWICLWAHYDFRYASNPLPDNRGVQAWMASAQVPPSPFVKGVVDWNQRTHLFPQGYVDGIAQILIENQERMTFMNGRWMVGGSPAFFPYTIWAKTSPLLFIFLIFGLSEWWWLRRLQEIPDQVRVARAVNRAPSFYNACPYVTLIIVFLAVAIAQNLNIAHRHILPIYPALDILAGGSIGLVLAWRGQWIKIMVALLMVGYAGESLATYPNYLTYFSPAVGGSSQGYKHLVDSSLDWGMDLPGLKNWLDEHNPGSRESFYLAYFGTDNPDYYGIKSTRLTSFPAWDAGTIYDLKPGIYAISATMFEGLYADAKGPWNKAYEAGYQHSLKNLRIYNQTKNDTAQRTDLLKKYPAAFWAKEYSDFKKLRFARLCAWLRHRHKPDDNVGHSILIWNLDQKEIDAALYGPPAELADSPLQSPES